MTTLDLTAKRFPSRVLSEWASARPGAAERMGINNATVVSTSVDGMNALFQPIASPSGFAVTDRSAMYVSTVSACLTKLAGAILQLPIEQYRMEPKGDRQQSPRGPLWWLLNETPSPAWTAAGWKEWIVRCVALRGDQHTEILRSRSGSSYGEVIGFKIHHPELVVPRRMAGRLVYDCMDIETGKAYTVDQDDMLHFAGFGFDGLRSLSMIQFAARNAIGNSLAAADYMGRSIGEGAMPQIALSYAAKMEADQQRLLRESFVATYGTGTGSRRLPLVLTQGGQATALSIKPIDMELMAMRRFEKEDICQALGVPPVLIGENDKVSSWGTGIEQITLGFVKYTVKPHLTRWEEELNRKLFRNAGPFLEFNLDELLRGDSKAQADADRAALGGAQGDGYKTVNEVRRSRNLPPIEGGDQIFKMAAKAPDTSKQDTAVAALADSLRELRAANETQGVQLSALASKPTAAPSFSVTLNQEPIAVTYEAAPITVEAAAPAAPASVVVQNDIHVPEAPAGVTNVICEMPEQPPATVQVVNNVTSGEVTVKLPDRKIVGTVERNQKDQIVKTTQIETDL